MAVMNMGSWPEPGPVPVPIAGAAPAAPLPAEDLLLTLFTTHYATMVRVATALLGDRARAEEVVQEAFVSVEPRLASLEPDSRVPYLRRAVMNGARSTSRRERAKKRQPILIREVTSSPEDHAMVADDQRRLLALLDDLPMRQRQCLVLRYYEGLTDVEVAAALKISPGSAKTHIRRGLEALRTRLTSMSEEVR